MRLSFLLLVMMGIVGLANAQSTPSEPRAAINVSAQVKVTQTGFVRNRSTGLWAATMTVANTSTSSIGGPIQVVFTNLSPNVTMSNASGMFGGNSYITVAAGALAPGAAANVSVLFTNPSNGLINFTPVTYSGSLAASSSHPISDAILSLEATGQIPVLDRSNTLDGIDADGNGVRDDIDRYITALPDTPEQKNALRQIAKGLGQAIKIGADASATESQLKAIDTMIDRAISCVTFRYPDGTAIIAYEKERDVEKFMANTRVRFDAYMNYNQKRSGTVSSLLRGNTCDTP